MILDMWHANPDVLTTDLENELVLLHPDRSEMFSLNTSGRLVWTGLPQTEAELSGVLSRQYGLSADQAERDVRTLLEALETRGLVFFR